MNPDNQPQEQKGHKYQYSKEGMVRQVASLPLPLHHLPFSIMVNPDYEKEQTEFSEHLDSLNPNPIPVEDAPRSWKDGKILVEGVDIEFQHQGKYPGHDHWSDLNSFYDIPGAHEHRIIGRQIFPQEQKAALPVKEGEITYKKIELLGYKQLCNRPIWSNGKLQLHQYVRVWGVFKKQDDGVLYKDTGLSVSTMDGIELLNRYIFFSEQQGEKDKEIERLKGLIENTYCGWFRAFYRSVSTMTAREISEFESEKWKEFKKENNL